MLSVQSGESDEVKLLMHSSSLHLLELKAISRALANLGELTKTQLQTVRAKESRASKANQHKQRRQSLTHAFVLCCGSLQRKKRLDGVNLQYESILYEKTHLQKEIAIARDFKSDNRKRARKRK